VSPTFLTELADQMTQARLDHSSAVSSGDVSAAAVAWARLEDLYDLARRQGVDLGARPAAV
jgi:hypothetical protein